MRKFTGFALLFATLLWLSGCATGDPRLQGTWQSRKVPMPVEMVKVTKVQTVKVHKGKHKTVTRKVPKTVTVAKTKSAPDYINLIVKYQGASLTMYFPPENGGQPLHRKMGYKVAASDSTSVVIEMRDPTSGGIDHIKINFDGPNHYWVNPANGEGWKEYYDRIATPN